MLHIKKIKPLYDSVVVTGNRYEKDVYDKSFIVASKGDLKNNQEVIAVGSTVRDINVGDKVIFNPYNYAKWKVDPNSIKKEMAVDDKVIEWHLPWVTIDDENGEPQECLLLNTRDIKFVYEGEEKEEVIIVPPKKSVLLN